MPAIYDSSLRFSTLSEFAPAAFFRDLEVPVTSETPRDNYFYKAFVYFSEIEGGKILVDTSVKPLALLHTSLVYVQ